MNALRALPRDAWLAIGLLALLALVIGVAGTWQARQGEQKPALSTQSTTPNGAKGLWLWLTALRYQVNNEAASTFGVPDHTGVMLLLEPSELVLASEWLIIDQWVKTGGLLVIAGEGPLADAAFRHYGFSLQLFTSTTSTVRAYHPLLLSPTATEYPNLQAQAYLTTERTDAVVPLAGMGNDPVAVVFNLEAGRVVLVSTAYPFSNAGLKQAGNPEFALSVISSGHFLANRMWFDEWHHGERNTRPVVVASGPENWLRTTPAGQALLYTALVIFVALLLQGRRFGRPIPAPQAVTRRDPVEYLTALANLHRRARHRHAILQQYHQRLKRQLGKRYRLDPSLNDEAYVRQLVQFNPALDGAALRQLLSRLTAPNVGEAEMVKLAAAVSEWLKELPS